jgi:hypothetical protein
MLVEAHDGVLHNLNGSNERIDYWRRPDVWRDIRESYELFLSRYPEDVDARTAFAQYADKANAFEVFLKQVEVLESSGKIDYAKFGGKPQLERDKRRIQELKKAAEKK